MQANTTNTAVIRNNLDDVSFIRPILIILMVLYHALCIHTGNWAPIEGMPIIPAYKELGRLAYSFMLESFVFVSGYVWAYQRETKGRKDSFWPLCKKKALRLLVPSIIFSAIYMLLYMRDKISIFGVIEGAAHLWFLPMLFWCFLFGWCILQFKLSPMIVLPGLYLISLVRPVGLPIHLSQTLYFMPFFFLGYYTYGYYDRIKEIIKGWHLMAAWGLFILAYGGAYIINSKFSIGWRGGQVCTLVYATIGASALLMTAVYITNRRKLNSWYVKLGALCMGVYVFQQFILIAFYRHTTLPSLVSVWALPWIGFCMALFLSLALTYIIRLSKVGKQLL